MKLTTVVMVLQTLARTSNGSASTGARLLSAAQVQQATGLSEATFKRVLAALRHDGAIIEVIENEPGHNAPTYALKQLPYWCDPMGLGRPHRNGLPIATDPGRHHPNKGART